MACINMFNDHQPGGGGGYCGAPPAISPRISFSNDFAVEPPPPRKSMPPVDPDFEFAVGGRPMIAADELFFKGRMLPLRDTFPAPTARLTTLRDELRHGAADDWARPPKASPRWKDFLGFRRAYGGSPVSRNKADGSSSAGDDCAAAPGKFAPVKREMKGNGGGRGSTTDQDLEMELRY